MSLASGHRLGGYEIVALIGAGGMGEVYRARDTKLNRDVALKVWPDGQRFLVNVASEEDVSAPITLIVTGTAALNK